VLRPRAAAGVRVIFAAHHLERDARLSDRVGIIKAGRMVAVGTIDDLRHTDQPSWVIAGPSPESWLASVPGAAVVPSADETNEASGRYVIEASPSTDDQAILRAALAAGPVREFAPLRPTLADIYRNEVAADSSAGGFDRRNPSSTSRPSASLTTGRGAR
jgi:ABC-2 type transport system ATP-binding protein